MIWYHMIQLSVWVAWSGQCEAVQPPKINWRSKTFECSCLNWTLYLVPCTLHVFLVPLSLYFARPSKINWRSKRLECRLSGSYVCTAVEWRQSTERFLIKHLQAQRLILIFLEGYKAWWKGELIKVVGARQVLHGTPYPRKINSCVEWFVMISL